MSLDVIMGEEDSLDAEEPTTKDDPETFFAKNAFRMVYQTNNFFLPQIRDLINRKEILNLRPAYQRRSRWNTRQKSQLIESLLLNIPVPPVFFYETTEARYEVMDGQQRLTAVRDFMEGTFALSGLPVLKPLNGLRYSECPPRIMRTLDRASLAAIILLLESEPRDPDPERLSLTDIRRFIFDRLNTGGTRLNAQEIRNALNPGVFNKVLTETTRFNLFTKVFGIPPYVEADLTEPNDYYENPDRQKNNLYRSMGDCQLVLRYFALKDKANIRGAMKSMLDRAMEVKISEEEGEAWKREYRERFAFLYELFDHQPFRLRSEEGHERVSAALYDASMVAINDCWENRSEIEADKKNVQQRLKDANGDPGNLSLLTGRQNTARAVQGRIELMRSILMPQ